MEPCFSRRPSTKPMQHFPLLRYGRALFAASRCYCLGAVFVVDAEPDKQARESVTGCYIMCNAAEPHDCCVGGGGTVDSGISFVLDETWVCEHKPTGRRLRG